MRYADDGCFKTYSAIKQKKWPISMHLTLINVKINFFFQWHGTINLAFHFPNEEVKIKAADNEMSWLLGLSLNTSGSSINKHHVRGLYALLMYE